MYYQETYKAREELLELLNNIPQDELHAKKADNLWTVGQNVEHLYLLENKITNSLRKAIAVQNQIEEKELNLAKILANRSYKVVASDDISPSSKPYTKEELIILLESSRANLQSFIMEADDAVLHQYGFNHRWIGDLSAMQWVQLIGYHERRHIDQIKETLSIQV
ncbi:DinB superfamily protein [Bacillus sp. THAF10]|uniref:DinB family protein n=1 Tax=Bacillus sp. THAF10 TaxID=2587848 RepID=UPI0012693D5E|nr:DinB family protein [Bacillus sp. THAF10]QFT89771.1 DinB superfamily protein [Bacillus sp. THAF10]